MTSDRSRTRIRVLGVVGAALIALVWAPAAFAATVDHPSGGPTPLQTAALSSAPVVSSISNGSCTTGLSQQTNVSLAWTDAQSANLDAAGGFLVNGYDIERSTAATGPFASVGTVSGQPPAMTFTDTSPSGATTPSVVVAEGGVQRKIVAATEGGSVVGPAVAVGQQVGIQPNTVAVTPDGTTAVVIEGAQPPGKEADVFSISGTTLTKVATFASLGLSPTAVAIDPVAQGGHFVAYVLTQAPNGSSGAVVPITLNGAASTQGAAIAVQKQGPVQTDPAAILVTPNGADIFVTNFGSHTISAIPAAGSVATNIALSANAGPIAVAVTPDSSHVYVADRANSLLDDITVATLSVTKTVTLSGTSPLLDPNVGTGDPNIVAMSPTGTTLYVAEYNAGKVEVFNTALASTTPDTVTATITLPGAGAQPDSLSLTPNGCLLYVADHANKSIDVVTTSSNTAAVAVPAASLCAAGVADPWAMAVTPDSTELWMAQGAGCPLAEVNTSNNALTNIAAGVNSPQALAITPSNYFYEVQALHGTIATGSSSNASASSSYLLGFNPGGWQ